MFPVSFINSFFILFRIRPQLESRGLALRISPRRLLAAIGKERKHLSVTVMKNTLQILVQWKESAMRSSKLERITNQISSLNDFVNSFWVRWSLYSLILNWKFAFDNWLILFIAGSRSAVESKTAQSACWGTIRFCLLQVLFRSWCSFLLEAKGMLQALIKAHEKIFLHFPWL